MKILYISLCILIPLCACAQSIEWVSKAQEISFGYSASLTSDNSYLQARSGNKNVAKYDEDGNLIWAKNICNNCPEVDMTYSTELPSGDLLHLSRTGNLYATNSSGDNAFVVGTILPDSLPPISNMSLLRYISIYKADQSLVIVANHFYGSTISIVRSTIELNSLEITAEKKVKNNDAIFFHNYNSNTGDYINVCLDVDSLNNRFHNYNIFDNEDRLLSDILIDNKNLIINDLILGNERSVYVTGFEGSAHPYETFVSKYNFNGELLYRHTIVPAPHENSPLHLSCF